MAGSDPAYDVAARENAAARADDLIILPPPAEKPQQRQRRKSKSGAFGIFRAALHMLRKRTDEKEAAAAESKKKEKLTGNGGNGGDWRKIVESMRPLHVQEMPASPIRANWPSPIDSFGAESPAPSCSSSTGTMSQYASANNLRDLCEMEEETDPDPDEVFDAVEGDEFIDAKAEEFIAQFYKSIHHQNSIHRLNRGV